MTKQYPTKQYLNEVISNREFAEGVPPDIVIVMARQLLAGMEQEPVARVSDKDKCDPDVFERGITACVLAISKNEAETICRGFSAATGCKVDWHFVGGRVHIKALRAAPQLPMPAVAITQHFDTIALDTAKMVMCDVNRRDEFLGGDIQLLSRIQCRIDDACRAAMLKGTHRDLPQPAADEPAAWISRNKKTGEVVLAEPCEMATNPEYWTDGFPVYEPQKAHVPPEMSPEMMRAVQLNSELGAYAAANLAGAYSLFREFWDVAIAAASKDGNRNA